MNGPALDMPPAQALDLLANDRRRMLLQAAVQADAAFETITIEDVIERIAAVENDCEPAALTTQQRKRVYIGCYQVHFPALVDAGALECVDEDAGEYRATKQTHALDELAAAAEARCAAGPSLYAAENYYAPGERRSAAELRGDVDA